MKNNQSHIRAELYKGIQYVLEVNDSNVNAVIRVFGKPDLFITFTCTSLLPVEYLNSVTLSGISPQNWFWKKVLL